MEVKIIASPNEQDIMLKTSGTPLESATIITTLPELHQLDWAIRKYLEGRPARHLKGAAGK